MNQLKFIFKIYFVFLDYFLETDPRTRKESVDDLTRTMSMLQENQLQIYILLITSKEVHIMIYNVVLLYW